MLLCIRVSFSKKFSSSSNTLCQTFAAEAKNELGTIHSLLMFAKFLYVREVIQDNNDIPPPPPTLGLYILFEVSPVALQTDDMTSSTAIRLDFYQNCFCHAAIDNAIGYSLGK